MSTDLSPAAALAHVAERAPATASIVDDDGTVVTAAALHAAVGSLATRCAALGLQRGDRIAYAGRNSPTLLLTSLAAAHLGAVFIPLNFRLSASEAGGFLRHTGTSVVVAEPEMLPLLGQVADAPITAVIDAPSAWAPIPLTSRIGAGTATAPQHVVCAADDLAVLMATSGSSGHPKAVRLTHGNLWWAARNIDETFPTGDDDVTLAVAPMFHIGGYNGFTLRTLVRGGTVLIRRTFSADRTLTDLVDGGVTTLFGVPAMYAALTRCAAFEHADLSGVRSAISGGAPMPPGLVEAFAVRGLLLRNSWGMTETAPAATCLPAADALTRSASVGVPLPHTQIRLVCPDTEHDVATPGVVGEVWAHGPNVTDGYWQDDDATAAALAPDGWLRTGDLAILSADGYLTIVGRRAELINTGGEKVIPGEVEAALADLPSVSGVVVVGAPDDTWGEAVVAVLEGATATSPSLETVREHAARHLARYKLPTRLVAVAAFPRTETGKLDRCAVRAIAAGTAAV